MLTRNIGKIIFGKATPTQIMLGSVLAGMLGFMPGFTQAPGLIALLVLLIVLINTPLPLAGLVLIIAKLLSLALLPVSFAVGRVLLDGPTQPLFQLLINAPVTALFGLDYYAVTGGLLLGLVTGIILGLGVIKGVGVIRQKLAGLEENSERYQKWASKGWVRLLLFVVAGGIPKKGFKALLDKRRGNPIRPLGAVIVLGIIVVGFLLQMLLAEPIVTAQLRTALERANGATVDLDSVDIDLRRGRLTLHQLAMADPNALETDLFRAAQLEADLSTSDLLRKRVTLDRVIITEARQGATRRTPGLLTAPRQDPPDIEPREGEKSIEDYIAEAEQWKHRLQQIQDWLERLAGPEEDPDEPVDPNDPDADEQPTWAERLEQRVAEKGYANVRASHLVTGRPTLTIVELEANDVQAEALEEELVDIRAQHLSTHPHLNDEPPQISVISSADSLRLDLHMAGLTIPDASNTIDFHLRNVAVDRAVGQLAGNLRPLSGGTMDLALNGTMAAVGGMFLDLPLEITIRDSVVRGPGGESAAVEHLMVPLGLRGPVGNPRITLDDERLADALVEAGANALAGRVRQEADRALDQALDRADDQLGGRLRRGLLGSGDSDSDGADADEEASEEDRQNRSLEDAASDTLRGIFGGGDD